VMHVPKYESYNIHLSIRTLYKVIRLPQNLTGTSASARKGQIKNQKHQANKNHIKEVTLKVLFPGLYNIAIAKVASIADNINASGGTLQWNVSFFQRSMIGNWKC
jgi:hypothetical protein